MQYGVWLADAVLGTVLGGNLIYFNNIGAGLEGNYTLLEFSTLVRNRKANVRSANSVRFYNSTFRGNIFGLTPVRDPDSADPGYEVDYTDTTYLGQKAYNYNVFQSQCGGAYRPGGFIEPHDGNLYLGPGEALVIDPARLDLGLLDESLARGIVPGGGDPGAIQTPCCLTDLVAQIRELGRFRPLLPPAGTPEET